MLTTVIGSYPLSYQELGEQAVRTSVKDQLEAGVSLVSDGQTRYDMIEYFARSIEGYEYSSHSQIKGKIGRGNSTEILEDLAVTREMTTNFKGIVTGPITLVFSSKIQGYYKGFSDENLYFDTADALLEIAKSLEKAGAKWIQIDEPFLSVGAPMEIARETIERIATNLSVPVALHACGNVTRIFRHMLQWRGITMLSHAFVSDDNFEVLKLKETQNSNKMIGLGCIDTTTKQIEELADIEDLIKRALEIIPADRIAVHPDCGLKLLPRNIALEKLKRMVTAASRVGLSI